VVAHRAHHRAPAHAELPGHRGDRPLTVPDLLTRPPAGPLGQRRPRRDRLADLGPRPCRAARPGAAPDPLGPHQQHRPPVRRNIPDQMRATAVRDRHHPAPRASRPPSRGLHQQLQLTASLPGPEDHEPAQAEHHRRALATGNVIFQLGPPMNSVAWSLRIMKVPVPFRPLPHRRVTEHDPRFMAKSLSGCSRMDRVLWVCSLGVQTAGSNSQHLFAL
jgi:hypothetical protein